MTAKPKTIERQFTFWGSLGYAPLFAVLCFYFIGYLSSLYISNGLASAYSYSFYVLGGLFAAWGLWAVWRIIDNKSILNRRSVAISELAHKNTWQFVPESDIKILSKSALLDLSNRDRRFNNHLKTAEWEYIEPSYAVYHKTKNGEYKAATIYYAVMAVELPRLMPNVVFDAKNQRGRQFKTIFDEDQLHQLEGNFGKYFDAYFAKDYTIDSLSFITPDVMEALIEAEQYDVEIVGNKLFLYGRLWHDAPAQLQDMSQKIAHIKQELLDNILTYRDERIAYADGRNTVHASGLSLKRRKKIAWATVVAVIIYTIFRMVFDYMSAASEGAQ